MEHYHAFVTQNMQHVQSGCFSGDTALTDVRTWINGHIRHDARKGTRANLATVIGKILDYGGMGHIVEVGQELPGINASTIMGYRIVSVQGQRRQSDWWPDECKVTE